MYKRALKFLLSRVSSPFPSRHFTNSIPESSLACTKNTNFLCFSTSFDLSSSLYKQSSSNSHSRSYSSTSSTTKAPSSSPSEAQTIVSSSSSWPIPPQDHAAFLGNYTMDTHAIIYHLRDVGGFSEDQAKALTYKLLDLSRQTIKTNRDMLATKADFAHLRSELQILEKADFGVLKSDLQLLERKMETTVAQLYTEMERMENRVIKWVIGSMATSIALMLGFLRMGIGGGGGGGGGASGSESGRGNGSASDAHHSTSPQASQTQTSSTSNLITSKSMLNNTTISPDKEPESRPTHDDHYNYDNYDYDDTLGAVAEQSLV